ARRSSPSAAFAERVLKSSATTSPPPLGQHGQVATVPFGDPTMPHQLKASSLDQRQTGRDVVVAPVHWRVVVFLRPGGHLRCAKAKKGQPSRPQHTRKAI